MVSYYCAYARETISKIKGKYITQVYRTQWYSENKTKHKKIMCIFHGIHCVIFIMEIRDTNCHCQFLFMVAGLWWTFFWFRCCIHLIHDVFTRVEATLFTVHKSGNEKDVSSRYTKSFSITRYFKQPTVREYILMQIWLQIFRYTHLATLYAMFWRCRIISWGNVFSLWLRVMNWRFLQN